MRPGLLPMLALLGLACGSAPAPGTDPGPGDAGPGDAAPGDAGPGAQDAAVSPGPDAGPREVDGGAPVDAGPAGIPTCQRACAHPRDCVAAPGLLSDEDNWVCVGGGCRNVGCRSDAECSEALGGAWLCRAQFAGAAPSCVRACAAPADCAVASPLFEADNHRCEDGACRWLGCEDTAECTSALADPRYVCDPYPDLGLNLCVLECRVAADCVPAGALPAYDLDNLACEGGRCRYLGCRSVDECRGNTSDDSYVCQ
jgi:hypothetical protein